MGKTNLPGIDLPALPGPDGKIGPYAKSGLRSITTSRVSLPAWKAYYSKSGSYLASLEADSVSCAHPQLELWLRIMQGLEPHMRIQQPPAEEWPLSRVIPRMVPRQHGFPFALPEGSYWVDYANVSSSLRHLPKREWTYKITEQFTQPDRAILGYVGMPELAQVMWWNRHKLWGHPFFQQFKEGGIASPDFSSWLQDPKPQAMIGERMTQQFVELGYAHGYNMIPTLSWQDSDMLRRVADMLGSLYPKVNTVFLYMAGMGVDRTAWMYSRLEDLQNHLAHLPFRFIANGIDSGWTVAAMREIFPRGNFHILTGTPWMQARLGFGSDQDRALTFRRTIHRMEDWHKGVGLPPLPPRPENPFNQVLDSMFSDDSPDS